MLYRSPRKKNSFSYGNLRFFQISNFKNRSFLSGQEVLQIEPNLVWSIPNVGRLWDKKNGPPNFSRKKVRISIGNIDFFNFSIFKNIEFLSRQGVIQSEPHLVWIITGVMRVKSKKNLLYRSPRKKNSFSYGNLRFFQISNF